MQIITTQQAADVLKFGKIIAYPTEAVYGLGCDPFNQKAVEDLLVLKERDVSKGLLLIAASWDDVVGLVNMDMISPCALDHVYNAWPGAVTLVFPATAKVPLWIRGAHNSVALRVTAHPVVRAICKAFAGPIVSTSANIADQLPARTQREVRQQFANTIEYIVAGRVGRLKKPTPIYDVLTGNVVRF
jgi:L-threonylcarbamoyladenylate synthase